MIRSDQPGRAQLIGGLWQGQRRMLQWSAASAAGVVLLLFVSGVIDSTVTLLVLAAAIGGALSSRALWRFEAWNREAADNVLKEMAPIGMWSAAGSATHWAFSQGYNYLIAGLFDVAAVAALAATRLLLMPVNLLSTGIGSLMLPTASGWLHQHGPATVFRRLSVFATGLVVLAACYMTCMWLCRDWIFAHILNKQFEHRDALLLAWSAVFMVMVIRDQLLYLPGACGQFRSLAGSTLFAASLSLAVSYPAMQHFGVVGAPLAVLVGEQSNIVGITLISLREIRVSRSMIGVAK